jgi:hypothetical protein
VTRHRVLKFIQQLHFFFFEVLDILLALLDLTLLVINTQVINEPVIVLLIFKIIRHFRFQVPFSIVLVLSFREILDAELVLHFIFEIKAELRQVLHLFM